MYSGPIEKTGCLTCLACHAEQAPEKRVVKLPVGRPVLFSEPNPNAANANSAVAISFQVRLPGPLAAGSHVSPGVCLVVS